MGLGATEGNICLTVAVGASVIGVGGAIEVGLATCICVTGLFWGAWIGAEGVLDCWAYCLKNLKA